MCQLIVIERFLQTLVKSIECYMKYCFECMIYNKQGSSGILCESDYFNSNINSSIPNYV